MKNIAFAPIFLLLVGSVFFLNACQRDAESGLMPVTLPSTTVTQATSTTSDLVVTSLKIPGIPAENIKIDQATKKISIQIPDGFNESQLKGTAKFGCTNCGLFSNRVNDSTFTFDWCQLYAFSSFRLSRKGQSISNQEFVDYFIHVASSGPLRVGPFPNYTIGETWGIQLPVENFYDTGVFSRGYIYHIQSGILLDSVSVYCGDPGNKKNNVITIIGNLDLPGACRFDLVKSNGRRASTTFMVNKSSPKVQGNTVVKSQAQVSFKLYGDNLYKEDNIEVLLRQNTGYTARMKPTDFSVRGRVITLQLPSDCPSGYFYVQAVRNGTEVPIPTWLNPDIAVLDDPRQPSMNAGVLFGPGGSLQQTVQPGERISVYVPMTEDYARNPIIEYVFVNIDDATKQFSDNVYVPYGYFMGSTEGSGAFFNIPANIPSGRYMVTPQRIMANGDIIKGLPYPKIYTVK